MYYVGGVIENPAYKGIMRLPLIIFCGVILAGDTLCDTNESCCLQKDLVKPVAVSDTACYIIV